VHAIEPRERATPGPCQSRGRRHPKSGALLRRTISPSGGMQYRTVHAIEPRERATPGPCQSRGRGHPKSGALLRRTISPSGGMQYRTIFGKGKW
jgi:hypothetical protein